LDLSWFCFSGHAGFDDQGRQFDASGNMVDWWTDEDSKRFMAKKQVVIDQFNAIEVIDGKVCSHVSRTRKNQIHACSGTASQ
jgi:predicted metalloendopeptidase